MIGHSYVYVCSEISLILSLREKYYSLERHKKVTSQIAWLTIFITYVMRSAIINYKIWMIILFFLLLSSFKK